MTQEAAVAIWNDCAEVRANENGSGIGYSLFTGAAIAMGAPATLEERSDPLCTQAQRPGGIPNRPPWHTTSPEEFKAAAAFLRGWADALDKGE